MKDELKWGIYLITLGMSLVAYAHLTFATRATVDKIYDKLNTIDQRVYDVYIIIRSKK